MYAPFGIMFKWGQTKFKEAILAILVIYVQI